MGRSMSFWDIIIGKAPRVAGTTSINIEGLDTSQMGIYSPNTFADIIALVKKMGKNLPLIVNFMGLDGTVNRSVDFVCGAVCALGGRLEKIGEGIYFFAPKNVQIDKDKKYKRT